MLEERRANRIPTSWIITCNCCSNPNAIISVVFQDRKEELCDPCFANFYPILTKNYDAQT